MATLITELANFAEALRFEDLPAEVVRKAKICILDTFGLGLAGIKVENAQVANNAFACFGAPGGASLWGTGQKMRAVDCVLPNSVSAHCFLQDDWDPVSHAHIGVAVVPTVFAVAEEMVSCGKDALAATVAGYEVESRSGVCAVPAFTRGFRASSVYAYFGAATAAGKLMKLNAKQLKNALGCAGGVAGGVLQPWVDGSMEWSYQEGFAARAGIVGATLAQHGFRGADNILEGPSGVNVCFSGTNAGAERALDGLSQRYFMLETCFKRFCTGGANQGSAAVAWHLHHVRKIDWRKIHSIVLRVPKTGTHERMNYAGVSYQGPFKTLDQCLISKPFAVACLLKTGVLDVNTVMEHCADPDVEAIAKKIDLAEDGSINGWNLTMVVELDGGENVKGTGEDIDHRHLYLNVELARTKFIELTRFRLGEDGAGALADLILSIEDLDSLVPIREKLGTKAA